MERRPNHAHATRARPIHGIAEDAIAPEAASNPPDTLSQPLASERTPIQLVAKQKSPMIEMIETADSPDEHNHDEHGVHTTAPSSSAPQIDFSLDAASANDKPFGPSTSTPPASPSGAASIRPTTPAHLAAIQSAVIDAQHDQIVAAQQKIDELLRERDCASQQASSGSTLSKPSMPNATPSTIEERLAELEQRNAAVMAENARLSGVLAKSIASRRSSSATVSTSRAHSAAKNARVRNKGDISESEHEAEDEDHMPEPGGRDDDND